MSELEPTRTYSNPTATDELRRLLDERGVEHYDGTECTLWDYEQTSESTCCYRCSADEIRDGFVNVWMHHLTPEQAIDATLGRGTCKLDFIAFTKDGVDFAGFRCDGCGFTQAVPGGSLWGVTRDWSYCPNCGRRVVE